MVQIFKRLVFISVATLFCRSEMMAGSVPFENYLSKTFEVISPCGLSFVDACFVINLTFRQSRWERMQQIGAGEGVAFTRVPAVYGQELPQNIGTILGKWNPFFGRRLIAINPNELGCLLSHLSILHKAEELGLGRIWVFEDDIILNTSLASLEELLSAVEDQAGVDNWDIIYTDVRTNDPADMEAIFKVVGVRSGTYSMLVSCSGRRKILDFYRQQGVYNPIDLDLGEIPGLRLFEPNSNLITYTRAFGSDTKLRYAPRKPKVRKILKGELHPKRRTIFKGFLS